MSRKKTARKIQHQLQVGMKSQKNEPSTLCIKQWSGLVEELGKENCMYCNDDKKNPEANQRTKSFTE